MNSITETIERALRAAGLDPAAGKLAGVTQVISQALASAGLHRVPLNSGARDMPAPSGPFEPAAAAPAWQAPRRTPRAPDAGTAPAAPSAVPDDRRFTTHTHAEGAASRSYKLYVPASYRGEAMPLIVMLHGCKQSPDDFARGTRMNELAEEHGFLVAYPAQSANANGSNCWNWFQAAEQTRAGTEASLIAGIVRAIGREWRVDERRVFVAGLSAGAAMAVILGATYPETFAGVAAHSGLPLGAAHDMPSAFAAMSGHAMARTATRGRRVENDASGPGTRTIVFHGDADSTVAVANGRAVAEQVLARYSASEATPLVETIDRRGRVGGRDCTTTLYIDAAGRTQVETWVVHGGAHAWSGGSPAGSYTDARGPDASAEIVRFFLRA